MNVKNSVWMLFVVLCFGLGIVLGRNTHSRSVDAAKPIGEAQQPLFTPVAASLTQQKMCDEQAAKKFNENGHGKFDGYTSHYDPAVNVCYIRVDSTGANPPTVTTIVYDAFGGRVYANYSWINSQNKQFWEVSPSMCEIHIPGKPDETCKTDTQFDELTEKYFGITK